MTSTPEESFPARVYWAAAIAAVAIMVLLYWFTSSFNIPLGAP